MYKRKPESLALYVALTGTLAVLFVFLADLALGHRRDLEAGEKRLQQFTVMMAEHTARAFEAVDILVREISVDLSTNRVDWPRWEGTQGWEYVAQRHSRAMPQMRDLIVFDTQGEQRFISSYFPTPRINVADHAYFRALAGGLPSTTYGPYVENNSGRYTYAIGHRLTDPQGNFSGVAFATVEPGYMQDFCWSNRLADDFDAVLTNRAGRIVASCRPADLSPQSTILGRQASEVLFADRPGPDIPETGLAISAGMIVSVSPVPGFPDLRLVAVIDKATVLAGWHTRLSELGTLGLLLSVLLLSGSLLVRRQVRELSSLTEQLANDQRALESRIQAATADLAKEKEAAETANTAKSRFLAAASHDLRQPMHALALFSADLQRQVADGRNRDLPRLTEKIATSTRLLGEMLDALLDISRLDIHGVKPNLQNFPLADVFSRLDEAFRRAAFERKMALRFHAGGVWVHSDPQLLERMLGNLLSNALRYSPRGRGHILVGVRRQGDKWRIEVRDNGVGIAAENRSAIFAEFFQVANTAREQDGGLGLGLSIVDRLARALDSEVTLRSRLGVGSTFAVLVAAAPAGDRRQPLPASRPSMPQIHFVGESTELAICRQLVSTWGFASSGGTLESVHQLRGGSIVICDTEHIPVMSEDNALIVLAANNDIPLPAHALRLQLPVRPARLRALLHAAGGQN